MGEAAGYLRYIINELSLVDGYNIEGGKGGGLRIFYFEGGGEYGFLSNLY